MSNIAPETLIDLARYPLTELEQPAGRAFLAASRAKLDTEGALVMPGFLLPAAAAAILAEAEALAPQSYYCAHNHNAYLEPTDEALAIDHPRNSPQVSDLGCVADDQIPAASPLRALYTWPALRAFLASLLGCQAIHPYADPLGSLNINYAFPGQQLGWHFDNADFATTLLLQPAESGGVFEYVPDLRGPGNAGYAEVARALAGEHENLRRLDMPAGTFVLFKGRNALHRVTPVDRGRPRIIAILSYAPKPGVELTEFNRRLFYGRVA